MKPSCCAKWFAVLLLTLITLQAASVEKKSAVLYYGDDISWSLVGIHDYIILQPDHVDTATHGFKLYSESVYAYVSVGEMGQEEKLYTKLDKRWLLGENKAWHSKILDIGNPDYRRFFFDQVVDPLRKKGFKNFFLDTLDSWQATTKTAAEKARMRKGLITLIETFHERYPESRLILNRGFEVLDAVHDKIEAVLIESLFRGLSEKALHYTEVSPEDRAWLMSQIEKIKGYHLPLIIVDYLPMDQKAKIQKTLHEIEAVGAIPYIGDRHLMRFGYSSKAAVKREVLLLYDDTEFDGSDDDKINSTSFHQLSTPLEYMGYIPILKPITTWKLKPDDIDRYAGATVWINGTYPRKYRKRFTKQIESLYHSGIKFLILESIEADIHKSLFKVLGIHSKPYDGEARGKLLYDKSAIGFEIDPFVPQDSTIYRTPGATPLCQVQYGNQKSQIAAITKWGGYAFDGTIMTSINKQDLWIANPFVLLQKTLHLSLLPAPDVTTENGKRILFSHVDGDGIMNRAEWDPDSFSGDVLYKEIFTRYKLPISVSIIEAETAPQGLYPKLSPKLEAIARKIFALPHIEAATHTYTHPFFWKKIVDDHLDPRFRLKVQNYDFSVEREIRGSLDYINSRLEPSGKHSRLLFWSGDCLPLESTLAYIYRNNFLQINGGDTTITNHDPWLSLVAPLAVRRGDFYQIFTGAQNENVYTNDWLGPFWGFKKVIQTFKLTDTPRRLKPIDIYYHLYSGSKRASLSALRSVYGWAITQDVLPLYTSEYIPKVMDYFAISIGREGEDWLVRGTRSLKTLRIPASLYPDYAHSPGIVGDKVHEKSRYLHLDTKEGQRFRLSGKESDVSRLVDANGPLRHYAHNGKESHFSFSARVPLNLRLRVARGCRVTAVPQADKTTHEGEIHTLIYLKQKDANVTLTCD